jgi:hypothetical protein
MSILAAIKREEQKVKQQLGKLQHQLNGLQAAAKALGNFSEPRNHGSQETRHVGGQSGKNLEGRKATLGQDQGTGEQGCELRDFSLRGWRSCHDHGVNGRGSVLPSICARHRFLVSL